MTDTERILQELHEAGVTARRNARGGVTVSPSTDLALSYRAASVLISEHGNEAGAIAVTRLKTLAVLDDVEGARVWLGVIRAIEALS